MKKYAFTFAYLILLAVPSLIWFFIISESINLKALVLVIILSFLVGGILEIWAVKQDKKDKFFIWEYNPKTTLNKKILGVAVEDMFLFLFLTPIFIIVAWETMKKLVSTHEVPNSLIVIGLFFIPLTYYIVYKLTKPN